MGAEKGSEYWKLRTKHGRDVNYTPAKLQEKANEYFQWCIDNPLIKTEIVKGNFLVEEKEDKDGKLVKRYETHKLIEVPLMRAFSLEGFCNFADIALNTFKNYEKRHALENLSDSKRRQANNFLTVCTRIRGVIETQQFEGATSDLLNPSIIARKLGLADRKVLEGNPEKPVQMVKRKVIVKQKPRH